MLCFIVYDKPWKFETKLTITQIAVGGGNVEYLEGEKKLIMLS
jgi:hypothetical protein